MRNDAVLLLKLFFAPTEAFRMIKNRERFSYFLPLFLLVCMLADRVAVIYLEHFPLSAKEPQYRNFMQEMTTILLPLFTWILVQYLVTTILNGESKLREIFSATICSFSPVVFFAVPVALFSQLLSVNDAGLYHALWAALFVWSGLLLIASISVMNTYTMRRVVLVLFLTVFGCAFAWTGCGLVYVLLAKLWGFVSDVVYQYRLYWIGR